MPQIVCGLTFAATGALPRWGQEVRRFTRVRVGRGVRVQVPHTNAPRALSLHAYVHTAIDMAYPIKTPIAPGPPSAATKLVVIACTKVCKNPSTKETAKR